MQTLTAMETTHVSGGVAAGPIVSIAKFVWDYLLSRGLDYLVAHRKELWEETKETSHSQEYYDALNWFVTHPKQ